VKALWVAIGFLTRLPVPRFEAAPGDFASAVRLYPLVGVLIGVVVAAAGWTGALVDPAVGAVAALAAWVWVTGALHLDGLADLTDGLGAAHGDRTRLLSVMADPHVGSFGVIALGLALGAKGVLLHLLLPHHWTAIITVPAAARIGPLIWARWLPPLRPGGLGAAIAGATRNRDLAGWTAILVPACIAFPSLAVLPLLILALGFWFRVRVGGVTGDVHGAGIELTEIGLLLALAAYSA
jgi:adenosylcobinamide-GDP ribazoletransferase